MSDRYRLLVDNLPDAFAYHKMVYNSDGIPIDYIFLDINTAFAEMIGIAKDSVVGKKVTELFPAIEESSFDWIGTYGQVALTGESVRFEHLFEPLNSWYEVTAYSDKSEYFSVIFRDISGHKYKQMQEELQEERNMLTNLLKEMLGTAAIWICLFDADVNVTFWNKGAEEISGYSAEEVIGHAKVWEWLFPDLECRAGLAELFRNIIQQGVNIENMETKICTKDRQYRSIIWHLNHHVVQGKTEGLFSLAIDLTERKKAEDELYESKKKLQASEAKYRLLANNTSDLIYSLDRESRYTAFNQSVCRAFGLEAREIIGKNYRELGFPEHFVQEWENLLHKVFKTGKVVETELATPMMDGTVRIYEVVLMPVFGEDERVTSIRGTSRDITFRKKMDEEILKANKLESIAILAGGIAHDFNNYLATLLGNVSLAKLYKNDVQKILEKLEDIESATFRAKNLADQLFSFAKGAALKKKKIQLNPLLEDVVKFTLSGSNVRCSLLIDQNIHPVEVDEGQLSQLFNNIIINAVQAMPEGGVVEVSAENIELKEDREVHSIPLSEGPYVKLSIKDEGCGIPENELHKIFDPFFTTKQSGSGLGLAISDSIIKNHGGYLSVDSELGVGTNFDIFLPASVQDLIAVKEKESIYDGTGKILVMDDNEDFRKVTGEMLTTLGYNAVLARDGREAIEIYMNAFKKGERFDLVIMDLTVPGSMGGKNTVREILKNDPGVRAVVSSGYLDDPVMADFKKYGFRGAIRKPYSIEELSSLVREVLQNDKAVG